MPSMFPTPFRPTGAKAQPLSASDGNCPRVLRIGQGLWYLAAVLMLALGLINLWQGPYLVQGLLAADQAVVLRSLRIVAVVNLLGGLLLVWAVTAVVRGRVRWRGPLVGLSLLLVVFDLLAVLFKLTGVAGLVIALLLAAASYTLATPEARAYVLWCRSNS